MILNQNLKGKKYLKSSNIKFLNDKFMSNLFCNLETWNEVETLKLIWRHVKTSDRIHD